MERDPIKVAEYGLSFSTSAPDTPIGHEMADTLAQAIDDHRRNLAAMVLGFYPTGPWPTPKRIPRWRHWLGQKLYDWALQLDPDLWDG